MGDEPRGMTGVTAARTLCVWCPDWPVVTARRADPALRGVPVVSVARIDGRVLVTAASDEARTEGVVPGLRRREAEARCPDLAVVESDPGADARAFESVARATEVVTPRIVLDRPGRGPRCGDRDFSPECLAPPGASGPRPLRPGGERSAQKRRNGHLARARGGA